MNKMDGDDPHTKDSHPREPGPSDDSPKQPKGSSSATTLDLPGRTPESNDGENTPTLAERGAKQPSARRHEAESLPRGESVGRYVVLDGLGAGGMGTVYAAYDPQLDRRVAIKLLRHRPGGTEGRSREQARLLREAQALAKLNDPHVVSVFDVGTHEGRIFLAMELVPGLDVVRWLAAEERSLDEVIDIFQQAGRGLAAAHAAGLVHRDFKGSNVMVREDGRALVLDFGLARARGPLDDTGDERWVALDALEDPTSAQGVLEQPLTMTGSILGTPAYMSPEQRAGAPADAAADQFSFCVAFYQAVYGEHPFGGRQGVVAGGSWQVVAAPTDSRVPAHLRRILLRGLEPIPSDRYGSMEALLKDLADDPAQRRRRVAAVLLLAAVFGSLLFAVFQRRTPELCQTAGEQFAETWNADRARQLETAFTRTGVSYAADVLATTRASLDAYRDAWVAMHTDTCEATHLRGEQSALLLDRRMDCLQQRRQETEALVELLTEQPEVTIERAVRAVAGLRPLAMCADSPALLSTLDLPTSEASREKVESLRLRLAKAGAQLVAGQYAASYQVAEPLVEEALELGYWPLTSEALRRLGGVQEASGRPEEAVESYRRAVFAAKVGGHDRMAAEALVRLVRVASYQQTDLESSRFFADLARDLLNQLSGSRDLEASLAAHEGVLALHEGKPEVSLEYHRRSLEILLQLRGPDHPDIARCLVRMSNAFVDQGDNAAAREQLERALQINLVAQGASHPEVGGIRERLGGVLNALGKPASARRHLDVALSVLSHALGDDHPKVAATYITLGQTDSLEGLDAQANKRFKAARRIYADKFGADHPFVGVALSNIGSSEAELGLLDDAVVSLEQALEIHSTTYGQDHPWVAPIMNNLGDVIGRQGKFRQSYELHRRAREIWIEYRHPYGTVAACGMGKALRGLGRSDEAIPLLRQAVEAATDEGDAGTLAECQFELVRNLETGDADEAELRRLAMAAYEVFEAAPLQFRRQLQEVTAWWTERGVTLPPSNEDVTPADDT